jgi:hypothetical protein
MPTPALGIVIKVRDDGPYKITGPVELVDADGNRFAVEGGRDRAARSRSATARTARRRFRSCERA